jgi:hypothetical protein
MIRLFIPDPDTDFLPILDPGCSGQKGNGSQIWIRNTVRGFFFGRIQIKNFLSQGSGF